MQTDNPAKGFYYSLGGALLLSTNYITVKYGLKGFNPETLSFLWCSAGAVFSFIIVLLFPSSRIQIKTVPNFKLLIFFGITTTLAVLLAWHGLNRLEPTFSSFLWRFLPALTIVLGVVFLKERLTGLEVLALCIMLGGGIWGVVGRWDKIGTGVIYTVSAVCAMASQLVVAKAAIYKIHPNLMAVYRTLIASLLLGAWIWMTGTADFTVEFRYWLSVLLGSFLGPCLSYLLTFHSYQYWSLSQSSIVLTMQPLLVLPLAYIFLGSLPFKSGLYGGLIILAGALLLGYAEFMKSKKADAQPVP